MNFVITGPGRSGSQMLRTALEKHSQIHCLGEVFLPVHFEQTYIPQGRLRMGDILESLCHASDKNIVGISILYNELFQSKYTTGRPNRRIVAT